MKVMIVEDEDYIREGLLDLIDWEQAGFEKPILCPSAIEALQILEKEYVDLIITDIYMPLLSGLEFIRMVKDMRSDVSFVILTGHDRFELAQEAVELGVKRYLLKPVYPDKLRQVVQDIYQEIKEKIKIKDWIALAEQKLSEYLPVIQSQFWQDLTGGKLLNPRVIENRARTAMVDLKCKLYSCLSIRIMNVNESEPDIKIKLAVRQIITALIQEVIYTMTFEQTELAIIGGDIRDDKLVTLIKSLEQNLNIIICLGIGRTYKGIELLSKSAKEAVEAVMSVRKTEESLIVLYDDIAHWNDDHKEYPYSLEKEILDMIRFREEVNKDIVVNFFNAIFPPKYSFEETKLILLQFVTGVYRLANEYSLNLPDFKDTEKVIDSILTAEEYIIDLLDYFIQERLNSNKKYVSVIIEKTKQIINDEYQNPDLSVAFIADKIGVTSNYLSRIFSSEEGCTCINYITKVRMEAAKDMLTNSSLKSYSIAFNVGYNNPNYFSAVFKKYTGVSPREYREKYNEF